MHPDDLEGRKMRPMSLTLPTDRDVEAVALHISSLPQNKPAPTQVAQTGDSTRGQAYFAVCTTCHGTDGAGNQALSAPSLTHLNDWYVLNSLKKFKHKIRGSAPRDAVAAQMIGMAGVLPNEQAMKDVIAYIGTLSNK